MITIFNTQDSIKLVDLSNLSFNSKIKIFFIIILILLSLIFIFEEIYNKDKQKSEYLLNSNKIPKEFIKYFGIVAGFYSIAGFYQSKLDSYKDELIIKYKKEAEEKKLL
jgi:predicted small integral membrane protein